MLYNTLIQDRNAARKSADSFKTIYIGTLIGEIETRAKMVEDRGSVTPSDEEVSIVLRAFHKKARETLDILKTHNRDISNTELEISLVESYLPQQYDLDKLKLIIDDFISSNNIISPKELGKIMKYLKETHHGLYEPSVAMDYIKTIIK